MRHVDFRRDWLFETKCRAKMMGKEERLEMGTLRGHGSVRRDYFSEKKPPCPYKR
jgi:hypothetical protein